MKIHGWKLILRHPRSRNCYQQVIFIEELAFWRRLRLLWPSSMQRQQGS